MHTNRDSKTGRLVRKMTPDQESKICQRYQELRSENKVAAEFGLSQPTVHRILARHGVSRRSYKRLSPEEVAILLKLWADNISVQEIATTFQTSVDHVYDVARERLGPACKIRSTRTYTLNEDVFDTITEESAYWIGFLMADGCISSPRPNQTTRYVTLALAEKDRAHVEAFQKFLGSNQPVPSRENQRAKANSQNLAYFSVASKRLAEKLESYGVVPRKSQGAMIQHLQSDRNFWRGLIDGDGHVCLFNRKDTQVPVIGLTASRPLSNQFADFVLSVVGARPNSHQQGNVWHTRCFFRKAEVLAEVLYKDCTIALPRKAEMAKQILARRDEIRSRSHPRRKTATVTLEADE